jgi:putative ATPase
LVVLKALSEDELRQILERAVSDPERGLGGAGLGVDGDALGFLARVADGDARTALNVLELAARTALAGGEASPRVDQEAMRRAFARKALAYDKSGDQHYDLISALHKAVRNSDADAGLYWLARMLEAGEQPLYVARRLVRFASEDVGLADPSALEQAVAAWQAVHFIGMPEGALALAQLVVYLAGAPKSNAVYRAYGEASHEALASRAEPPPLWIRNAPTRMMRELGYGKGYRYAHDEEAGVAEMDCLPDALQGRRFYQPTDRGAEKELGARLETARRIRKGGQPPE